MTEDALPASTFSPTALPTRQGALERVRSSRTGRLGIVLLAIIVVAALAGPSLVPHDPNTLQLDQKLAGPSGAHWLGTDQFGRDTFSRIVDGAQRSLGAAVLVLLGATIISLTVGFLAGMLDGPVDVLLMRLVDIILAFPSLILALAIVGALGPSFLNLLLALTVSSWARNARVVRALVLAARRRPDVLAARMAGLPVHVVVLSHIVPDVTARLVVVATVDVGRVLLSVSGLSFLGLGAQPPDAEWGAMLADSRLYFTIAPWLLVAPSAAIVLTVTAANLIGESARDALEPEGQR